MELLHAAFLNLEEFYRRIYWSMPTATTVSTDAYTLSYSGIRWLNSANQFWYHMPLHQDAVHLRLAEKFYQKYSADFTINYTEPLMPGLGGWLYNLGYRERVVSPIMALEGRPLIQFAHPTAQIVRAEPRHHEALLRMMYEIFFIGPEVSRSIVQPEHLEPSSPMRHYVAYLNGEPVGCGTLSLSHGIGGLWSIGTLRPQRKQGIASALVGHILDEAAQSGVQRSILLASPMGRPLYEGMGYRWIGDAVQYGPEVSW